MSDPGYKFDNGDQVKDTITGFKGVIVARTQWMNECIRYAVQPRDLKDGEVVNDHWFDEEQLELVKGSRNLAPKSAPSGGPRPDPVSPSDR